MYILQATYDGIDIAPKDNTFTDIKQALVKGGMLLSTADEDDLKNHDVQIWVMSVDNDSCSVQEPYNIWPDPQEPNT